MKTLINAVYNKDTSEIKITCGDRVFDVSRIQDMPIEQWAFPFSAKGVRWNGLYEELKSFAGCDDFSLYFDSDDASFGIVKHALLKTPVKLIGPNNSVTIVYEELPFRTKITVNGDVFDTVRIQNRSIEEWLSPISLRGMQWHGIFTELEEYIGTSMYTIYFVGPAEFMELLMAHAPDDVNVFYRDPQMLAKQHGAKSTTPFSIPKVNAENLAQTARKAAETIRESVSPGEVLENADKLPIKNSFIRNNIMTILAAAALVLLFLPFASFAGKASVGGTEAVSEAIGVSGFELMFGVKRIPVGNNRTIFAFLLLLIPLLIIALNYIKPLKPYKKMIAVAASALGIVAEIISLLGIRGVFKNLLASSEATGLKMSLGIGFFLILLCYVLIAVVGLVLFHGMELPKKKKDGGSDAL